MNFLLLKSIMVLNNDTQTNLSKALNIAEKTLSEKLNNKSQFNLNELRIIADRYNLSDENIRKIFFN